MRKFFQDIKIRKSLFIRRNHLHEIFIKYSRKTKKGSFGASGAPKNYRKNF